MWQRPIGGTGRPIKTGDWITDIDEAGLEGLGWLEDPIACQFLELVFYNESVALHSIHTSVNDRHPKLSSGLETKKTGQNRLLD